VRKEKEFWSPSQVLDELQSEQYFSSVSNENESVTSDSGDWPPALQEFVSRYQSELESELSWNAGGPSLALSALGGVICYLRSLHLDKDLLSLKKIRQYSPEKRIHEGDGGFFSDKNSCLVLDGKTLVNLEIFENSLDRGRTGTLLNVMEHCVSKYTLPKQTKINSSKQIQNNKQTKTKNKH
jgi:DNA mismatch repair protein MSH6